MWISIKDLRSTNNNSFVLILLPWMFLSRVSSVSTGQIFGYGCWDGQCWITRTCTVLEGSTENQDHGTQVSVCAPYLAMSLNMWKNLHTFGCHTVLITIVTGCISPWRPLLIKCDLPTDYAVMLWRALNQQWVFSGTTTWKQGPASSRKFTQWWVVVEEKSLQYLVSLSYNTFDHWDTFG